MKKLFISFGFILSYITIIAQNHVDALCYSQPTIGGTARSVAMGGAFGALGSDFSCLSQNPAGMAFYRSSELTFTPEFYNNKTTSRYSGNEIGESKFNFNISNFGYVATFKESQTSLKSVSFGIGYNRIANFHRNTHINGINDYSSYGDYMAAVASGSNYLDAFSTDLFYQGYVIDPDGNNGYTLSADFLDNSGNFMPVEQDIYNQETGRINEWNISLGLNFNDMFYFGGSFGILPLYYKSEKNTKEFDSFDPNYQYFDYYESIDADGTGYNGKIGFIFKPIQLLRLGIAYHLPTTYIIHEKYNSNIETPYGTYFPTDLSGDPIEYSELDYRITTPSKAIASVGIVLGKLMVIDGDMEFVNYNGMHMSSSTDNFSDQNELIKEVYHNTVNLKAGSEIHLGSTYLRGGLGFYGSPYASTEENSDAYKLSYSCGIGFRDESFFFDIAYQFMNGDERLFLYSVDINGINDAPAANIDTKVGRVMTTIGFKF